LQPDLLFVSSARLGIIGPEYIIGAPDLVVEILSPHRTAYDRVTKLDQYASYGVGEYWIVDPVAENIEVYVLAGERCELRATLGLGQSITTPLLPAWQLALGDLFAQ
jgi:Uma2 family endonuclease